MAHHSQLYSLYLTTYFYTQIDLCCHRLDLSLNIASFRKRQLAYPPRIRYRSTRRWQSESVFHAGKGKVPTLCRKNVANTPSASIVSK